LGEEKEKRKKKRNGWNNSKRVGSRGKKKEAHPVKWMSFRSKIQSLRM
jgi:hypothetical protein